MYKRFLAPKVGRVPVCPNDTYTAAGVVPYGQSKGKKHKVSTAIGSAGMTIRCLECGEHEQVKW